MYKVRDMITRVLVVYEEVLVVVLMDDGTGGDRQKKY